MPDSSAAFNRRAGAILILAVLAFLASCRTPATVARAGNRPAEEAGAPRPAAVRERGLREGAAPLAWAARAGNREGCECLLA